MILVGIIHKVQHNMCIYIYVLYIIYSYFSTASYASHVYVVKLAMYIELTSRVMSCLSQWASII